MRKLIHGAIIALPLLTASVMATAPAAAAVDFSLSLGNAAFGYSDGYWDRDHHWHTWRSRDEARYFRRHYAEHYAGTRHDRAREHGWRNERWWDQVQDQYRDRH
jgi:hypothetical protein